MLDIRFVRENPEIVKENIKKKFQDHKLPMVDEVIELDTQRRAAIVEADNLRSERNKLSKQVGMLMGQAKKDPSKLAEAEEVKAKVKADADRLAELEVLEKELDEKVRKIYAAGGVACVSAPMDSQGVLPGSLTHAQVLHCSPSHHFPTGLVTTVTRRKELLNWAKEGKWIIEDDYDSEFRFDAHPKPTMQTLDREGRVIYMNTFSKSLAPSIRISYMVLPGDLMEEFRERLGFYSCTVPSFEQYTLARFLSRGHFEKHINRMRKFYRQRRNTVITHLQNCPFAEKLTILEQDAGLHFLVQVQTDLTDRQLTAALDQAGIRIQALSDYYHDSQKDRHCLVVNYSGIREENLEKALEALLNSVEC